MSRNNLVLAGFLSGWLVCAVLVGAWMPQPKGACIERRVELAELQRMDVGKGRQAALAAEIARHCE